MSVVAIKCTAPASLVASTMFSILVFLVCSHRLLIVICALLLFPLIIFLSFYFFLAYLFLTYSDVFENGLNFLFVDSKTTKTETH